MSPYDVASVRRQIQEVKSGLCLLIMLQVMTWFLILVYFYLLWRY